MAGESCTGARGKGGHGDVLRSEECVAPDDCLRVLSLVLYFI